VRYSILEKISGGHSVIYKAEDTATHRVVALELLPPGTVHPRALLRFQQDAQAASTLNHPNICAVYEIGEEDGQSFIAMELLQGTTLSHRLESGPLPPELLANLSIEISNALAAAHAKNILHGGLSPASIFITADGHAKILDFGLARASANTEKGPGQRNVPSAPPAITPYMSPEQVDNKPTDARSDLFSLGALLYEMATATRAFEAESPAGLSIAILKSTPTPASRLNPAYPTDIDRLISKALQKDPETRYQQAARIHADLKFLKHDLASAVRYADPVAEPRITVPTKPASPAPHTPAAQTPPPPPAPPPTFIPPTTPPAPPRQPESKIPPATPWERPRVSPPAIPPAPPAPKIPAAAPEAPTATSDALASSPLTAPTQPFSDSTSTTMASVLLAEPPAASIIEPPVAEILVEAPAKREILEEQSTPAEAASVEATEVEAPELETPTIEIPPAPEIQQEIVEPQVESPIEPPVQSPVESLGESIAPPIQSAVESIDAAPTEAEQIEDSATLTASPVIETLETPVPAVVEPPAEPIAEEPPPPAPEPVAEIPVEVSVVTPTPEISAEPPSAVETPIEPPQVELPQLEPPTIESPTPIESAPVASAPVEAPPEPIQEIPAAAPPPVVEEIAASVETIEAPPDIETPARTEAPAADKIVESEPETEPAAAKSEETEPAEEVPTVLSSAQPPAEVEPPLPEVLPPPPPPREETPAPPVVRAPEPEQKIESKVEQKLEQKLEPKSKSKPEPKLESKPAQKLESKPPKLDQKFVAKSEPKSTSKPEQKVESKAAPKVQPKPEPKLKGRRRRRHLEKLEKLHAASTPAPIKTQPPAPPAPPAPPKQKTPIVVMPAAPTAPPAPPDAPSTDKFIEELAAKVTEQLAKQIASQAAAPATEQPIEQTIAQAIGHNPSTISEPEPATSSSVLPSASLDFLRDHLGALAPAADTAPESLTEQGTQLNEATTAALRAAVSAAVAKQSAAAPANNLLYGIVAVLCVVALAAVWGWRQFSSRAHAVIEPLSQQQITHNPPENRLFFAGISPNGQYLVYCDTLGLHLSTISTGAVRDIPLPDDLRAHIWDVVWFPDGENLLLVSESAPTTPNPSAKVTTAAADEGDVIWATTIFGGNPRRLRTQANWPAVSPDGASIAFISGTPTSAANTNAANANTNPNSSNNAVWVMGANGENPRVVASSQKEFYTTVGWSPTGDRVAYEKSPGYTSGGVIETVPFNANASAKAATSAPANENSDNASSSTSNSATSQNSTTKSPLPTPTNILTNSKLWSGDIPGFLWLHDGRMLFLTRRPAPPAALNTSDKTADNATGADISDFETYSVAVDPQTGKRIGNAVKTSIAGFTVSATADAKQLVSIRLHSREDVWVAELSNSGAKEKLDNIRRFTVSDPNRDSNDYPTGWSVDSKSILFSSDRLGVPQIFTQPLGENSNEPNSPAALFRSPDTQRHALMTPDGAWILYWAFPPANGANLAVKRLMRLPASATGATTEPQEVLESPLDEPVDFLCPRGTSGFCVLRRWDGNQLFFYTLDPARGQGQQLGHLRLTLPQDDLDWDVSRDVTRVALSSPTMFPGQIRLLDLRTSNDSSLPLPKDWRVAELNWSASGDSLLLNGESSDVYFEGRVDLNGQSHILIQRPKTQYLGPLIPAPDDRHVTFYQHFFEANAFLIQNF
jgi:serine/threonine protein kinase/Tol biopolymer transport system component